MDAHNQHNQIKKKDDKLLQEQTQGIENLARLASSSDTPEDKR